VKHNKLGGEFIKSEGALQPETRPSEEVLVRKDKAKTGKRGHHRGASGRRHHVH